MADHNDPVLYVPQGELDTLDGDGCAIAYPTVALAEAGPNGRRYLVEPYVSQRSAEEDKRRAVDELATYAAKIDAELEALKATSARQLADAGLARATHEYDLRVKAEKALAQERAKSAALVALLVRARKHVRVEHGDVDGSCRANGSFYGLPDGLTERQRSDHPDVLEFCNCDYRERIALADEIDAALSAGEA